MINHKNWDINEIATGRHKKGKPIIGAIFQNGLNDIELDGSFVPCDMRLDDIADGVTTHSVKRGRYKELRFADIASVNKHLCKYKDKDGNGQSIKYIDDDCGLPDVSKGKPKFTTGNGITIEHTPTYNGVQIELVISDPVTAPLEYTFSIKDYGQVYEFTELNGAIIATGVNGKKIIYQAPYVVDANEEVGTAHYVLMGRSGGYYQFKKIIDDEVWFRNAAAPVRIDPTIIIDDITGTLEDTWIYDPFVSNNYGGHSQLRLTTTGGVQSILLRVDLTVLEGMVAIEGYFGLDVYTGVFPAPAESHVILTPWGEGNKNGGVRGTGESSYDHSVYPTPWNIAGCKGDGSDRVAVADSTYTFTAINNDTHFPVSAAALQGMIDNPSINFGWLLESTAGSSAIRARSNEGSGNNPYLYVEYVEKAIKRFRKLGRGLNRGLGRKL